MSARAPIHVLARVESTNDEARLRLGAGGDAPFWIVADVQTKGRGRRGAVWEAASGDLMMSGGYRLACRPSEAAQLSFAAALAVSDLVLSAAPDADVAVKWPNDVLVGDAKIAGVLLESAARGRGLDLVVGVGVNLVSAPQLADRATIALADLWRAPIERDAAAEFVAEAFESWRGVWAQEGFGPLRAAWLARAYGVGRPVRARLGDGDIEGVFVDLDADGALILDVKGARTLVRAGEIYFGADTSGAAP